jgi:hypothetical protein
MYAAFIKLSARLLRYKIRWLTSFAFAAIIWLIAVFARILDLGQPLAIAVGHSIVVLVATLLLGGGFSARAALIRAVSQLVLAERLVFRVSRSGLCSLLPVFFFYWLMSSFIYSPQRPNQALERTTTRSPLTFCVTKTFSLRATLAAGGGRLACSR